MRPSDTNTTQHNTTMNPQKAILYKVEAEWVLELICNQSHSKTFARARAAKDFARAKRIRLKRVVECDS